MCCIWCMSTMINQKKYSCQPLNTNPRGEYHGYFQFNFSCILFVTISAIWTTEHFNKVHIFNQVSRKIREKNEVGFLKYGSDSIHFSLQFKIMYWVRSLNDGYPGHFYLNNFWIWLILDDSFKDKLVAMFNFRPISTVSLLLSCLLFFERSISHLLWPSCYLSSQPSHGAPNQPSNPLPLLCLQWHPFFCLLHTNSGCIRRYYHCLSPPFVFYLPSTECSPPLSSTTESDSVFYSRCLP